MKLSEMSLEQLSKIGKSYYFDKNKIEGIEQFEIQLNDFIYSTIWKIFMTRKVFTFIILKEFKIIHIYIHSDLWLGKEPCGIESKKGSL
jgi:hypothetical protein